MNNSSLLAHVNSGGGMNPVSGDSEDDDTEQESVQAHNDSDDEPGFCSLVLLLASSLYLSTINIFINSNTSLDITSSSWKEDTSLCSYYTIL